MQDEVRARPLMRPGPDPVSNVCVFSARGGLDGAAQSALNAAIAQDLQERGTAVFSTTDIDGVTLLRAAITNHRSTAGDIRAAVAAVDDAAARLAAR